MAEFCRECFDKVFGDIVEDNDEIIESEDLGLCEGCGEIKQIVLEIKR